MSSEWTRAIEVHGDDFTLGLRAKGCEPRVASRGLRARSCSVPRAASQGLRACLSCSQAGGRKRACLSCKPRVASLSSCSLEARKGQCLFFCSRAGGRKRVGLARRRSYMQKSVQHTMQRRGLRSLVCSSRWRFRNLGLFIKVVISQPWCFYQGGDFATLVFLSRW